MYYFIMVLYSDDSDRVLVRVQKVQILSNVQYIIF